MYRERRVEEGGRRAVPGRRRRRWMPWHRTCRRRAASTCGHAILAAGSLAPAPPTPTAASPHACSISTGYPGRLC